MQILKFCFQVSPQILTEDPCRRSRRWQKLTIGTSADLYRWQKIKISRNRTHCLEEFEPYLLPVCALPIDATDRVWKNKLIKPAYGHRTSVGNQVVARQPSLNRQVVCRTTCRSHLSERLKSIRYRYFCSEKYRRYY